VLAVFEIITLIEKNSTVISRTDNNQDIINDNQLIELGQSDNFNFAFSLVVNGEDLIADPTYIEVSLEQIVMTWVDGANGRETRNTISSIPYVK
jgi:hypothetical protein